MVRKLTAYQIIILKALSKKDSFLYYMPYMGRFRQHPYYFVNKTMLRFRAPSVESLIKRELLQRIKGKSDFDRDSRTVITLEGKKVLLENLKK